MNDDVLVSVYFMEVLSRQLEKADCELVYPAVTSSYKRWMVHSDWENQRRPMRPATKRQGCVFAMNVDFTPIFGEVVKHCKNLRQK